MDVMLLCWPEHFCLGHFCLGFFLLLYKMHYRILLLALSLARGVQCTSLVKSPRVVSDARDTGKPVRTPLLGSFDSAGRYHEGLGEFDDTSTLTMRVNGGVENLNHSNALFGT